tara:strand:+ start:24785 stop:27838 length:3054 start_codon:yes stop_codon:yes gene_type:complete
MKLLQLLIYFLLAISAVGNAQIHRMSLDTNAVNAEMSDKLLFHGENSTSGYEVPAGNNTHLVFYGMFILAGHDQQGQLRMATMSSSSERDLYRGPYSSTDQYYDPIYMSENESSIWSVSRAQIIYHIDNYDQPNYQAPRGITEWPGNGNTSVGEAQQLAPFEDLNNNTVYEPELGEYPCIKGDKATYCILNDDGGDHYLSISEKLEIELHTMMYQFVSADYVDTTTFINTRVINRGSHNYSDFTLGFYLDPDIGFAEDEFIGCDSIRHLAYAYNGLNNDPGGQGSGSFGNNPPAVGFKVLNREMDYFGIPSNENSPIGIGFPANPTEYWDFLKGKWLDGTDYTYGGNGYGGSTSTTHLYTGNPATNTGWTEVDTDGQGASNDMGDRRMIMSIEPLNLSAGSDLEYDFAVITSRRGDHLENVQGVIDLADSVQQYYNNQIVNYNCQEQGTGIQDTFIVEEPNYKTMFEITRVDGEGNMMNDLELKEDTENAIIWDNNLDEITYKRGKGPIDAYLIDTVNYQLGHYVLKFNDYTNIDSANWTLYRYNLLGGFLFDSVESVNTIANGNEQLIPQWGMAIRIQQYEYLCSDGSNFCQEPNKIAQPISSSIEYSDTSHQWLSGVEHNNGFSPMNWVMSGDFSPSVNMNTTGVNNPFCYSSNFYDPQNMYTDLLDGIVSPGRLARYRGCSYRPIQVPGNPILSEGQFESYATNDLSTVHHPGVNIVLTENKSLWTRCAVIELNDDENTSLNNGKPGLLRQSPSVDKNGNQPGDPGYSDAEAGKGGTQPMGMGWFPGYAVDVETGRRLNMAFCENSTLINDNGDDMIWNPTERLMDSNGNYVLGGQHVIYVFGGEKHNMPNYDEGDFLYNNLSAQTATGFRNVYGNLSWVVNPLLEENETLLSTKTRIKIRTHKKFKERLLTGLNDTRPMFTFDVVPYQLVSNENHGELKTDEIKVYPNPTTDQFTVKWNGIKPSKIKIFSISGVLVFEKSVEDDKQTVVDLTAEKPGVYLVKLGQAVRKVVKH